MIAFVLLAVTIALNVAGQLLIKRATMGRETGAFVRDVLFTPWFLLGAAAHGATMIAWLLTLRRLPLTVAHPFTGSVFLVVPFASHLLWSEPLGVQRAIGIAVIAAGIAIVGAAT
jgi:undecaprenyl phosphate-alpha-L-ara4N flippase subunit ArnE